MKKSGSKPVFKTEVFCVCSLEMSYFLVCVYVCVRAQSCLTLCDPLTVPLRILCPWDFSRREYWSGSTFPNPGDLPDPRIETSSLALRLLHWQTDSLPTVLPRKPLFP